MKISEFIKRYGFSTITGTVTLLAYKDQLYTHKEQMKALEYIKAQREAELQALNYKVTTRWNFLKIKAENVQEVENKIEVIDQKINTINNQLTNKVFSPSQTEGNLVYMKNYFLKERENLVIIQQKEDTEIRKCLSNLDNSSSFDWV